MRILILSQHYWPEPFLIDDVAKSLREMGCEITVLTGQPNYPEGAVYVGYAGWKCTKQRHPIGYEILRVPIVPRGSGALGRILNYTSFVASASIFGSWLARGKQFDVVLVYAPSPILQALPALLLRLTKGAAVAVWVQDLWPDSLQSTGYVTSKWILRFVGAVTRFIYRNVDLILAQSRGFVENIRPMAGTTPVVYHPNPGPEKEPKEHHGQPAQIVTTFKVVFAGNLGTAQSLDTILDAAEATDDAEIEFVIVGDGSRADWMRGEVSRRGLLNVNLVGRKLREEMPRIFEQAAVLLVTLVDSENYNLTIPSKVPAYMAAGKPIVASLAGEAADEIRRSGGGLAVPPEDGKALAQVIEQIKNMPAEARRAMGRAGRNYYENHFEPRTLARAMMVHFQSAREFRRL